MESLTLLREEKGGRFSSASERMSKSSSDGEVRRRHFKHKAWWMQRPACKNLKVEWK